MASLLQNKSNIHEYGIEFNAYFIYFISHFLCLACQPSKRSGEVWITIRDDNRVELSGYGCVVLQGTITLP